ncbi:MAG: tetratricopeptide repeat protein [Anaerolineales bacterium]|nr:MAG: tetratricopeptide repeat protein [Anaerolineales bacterium]
MSSFIADLKTRLPQSEWPLVVAALRNEPTLWAELQDAGFGAQALEAAGTQRNAWSPAFLGLLRLGQAGLHEELRAKLMDAVAEKLRYQAASAYEQVSTQGATNAPDVEQAALLALALRERRRVLGNWEQLAQDLSIAPAEFWKLPLAALFGMLPQPQELLAALLSAPNAELHKLGLHALTSNPLTVDEQSAVLLETIADYPIPQFLAVLRQLAHMHLPLARQAARFALHKLENEPQGEGSELSQIERLLLQAEIRQLSGQPEDAAPLLHAAWGAAQRVQAELAGKLAENAAVHADAPGLAAMPESAAAAAKSAGSKHPAALIAAARVALKSGDVAEAQRMAAAALAAAQDSAAGENATLMRQLGEIFVDLKLGEAARQAAELAVQHAPNDADSAAFLSRVMTLCNEPERALQAAHLAAALAPERSDLRRQLAKALQASQQGAAAYGEWQAVLAQDEEPTLDDLFGLAQSALDADEIGECIQACQRVLAVQATHGGAHALMGKALVAQGDANSAIEHLRRATELAPAQHEAWIVLAELLRDQGDVQAARDTLFNAQQFTKPNPELQHLLGEIYLTLEENEAALGAFSRAVELLAEPAAQPNTVLAQNTILQLGRLQRVLGHSNQARHTLERGVQSYPQHAGLQHELGKLLLALKEAPAALAALQVTLQAEPANSEALLDAAQAQLLTGAAAEAEGLLRTALEQRPLAMATALLGEALAAQAKHGEAIHEFEAALRSELAQEPGWNKRLVLGKALAQAKQGEHEEALRVLEALDVTNPNDPDVLHALCMAYSHAGRTEEAFQIASKVYMTSGKDEHDVLWFANQAEALGKNEDARRALGKGIAEHGSAAHILRLAELEWQDGTHEKAVDTLAALLRSANGAALAKAGRFLLERRAAATSVSYFKRALELEQTPALLDALTEAYEHSQQWNEALATIEKNLTAEPGQPALLARKARILQAAGRPQAALEVLEQAIERMPDDLGLLANKARLLRAAGEWAAALTAAEKAFHLDHSHQPLLQLAVELALATLQPERARALLAEATPNSAPDAELACLQAELALDSNEELAAAKALAPALESDQPGPRVLALQSQMAARRGDRTQAEQYLNTALEMVNTKFSEPQDALTLISLARAAQGLLNYEAAVNLLQLAVKLVPGQALAQFALGKAIVQRAEWQQLCAASNALAAPGADSTSPEVYAAARAAFTAALSTAPFAGARAQLEHWLARAALRFGNNADVEALPTGYPSSAGEAAALVYAAHMRGDLRTVEANAKGFWRSPEVLVERALAFGDADASSALKWMLGALEQKPHLAPYHALAARFAQQAGQAQTALEHIRQAIALSPVQAMWQAFAGKLLQQAGALADAIDYFEHAVAMQPQDAERHFELGQAQLDAEQYPLAQKSLEQAAKLQPKSAAYALALAQAYKLAGDLKQAGEKAAAAQKLAPNSNAALVLQAEIALHNNETATAKSLAESALRLAPTDSKALSLYAECLHAVGEVDDALAVLERSEQYAQDKLPIQLRRAQLLPAEKGLSEVLRLSKANTERPDVYLTLSEMLANTGETLDAIHAAQRAAKKADSLPLPQQARLHLHLGKLLKASGQLDQSLHHLDEAAALAPHLSDVQIERGQVFLSRRQFKQAMQALELAAAAAPHSPQPHLQAAQALKDVKDYTAAEAALRKAAQLAPRERSIQRQLAAVIALNLIHQPQEVSAL